MSDQKSSILLVEDDYLDSMGVERELKKLNIDNPLYVARNGKEALAMLRGEGQKKIDPQPSIVILDINMPRLNGFEFLEEVRKDPVLRSLNVFILTTSNDELDREAARDLNVAGFIEKPLSFEKFGTGGTDIEGFNLFVELLQIKDK